MSAHPGTPDAPLEIPEDAYGTRKRMEFIEAVIAAHGPRTILDVGCGTGLVSLALAARHPDIRITAVDNDSESILHARSGRHPASVVFLQNHELDGNRKFDLIIASEVLEHVDAPEAFLRSMQCRLNDNGRLLLTVPNGYGPYEIMSLVEGLLRLCRVYDVLRMVKHALFRKPAASVNAPITLALSPHVNFFSHRRLSRLLVRAGFTTRCFQARTFLCGFVLDHLLRGERLIAWNAAVADKLPPSLCSDWMFLLESRPPDTSLVPWSNGLWGRLHRHVNRKCLTLVQKA